MAEVCIVIPTCDRPKLLQDCVDSINKNTGPNSVVIVVVDSSSQFVRIESKITIQHIRIPPAIIGFSKVVNDGAAVGIKDYKADFVIWLNDDCIVYENWLTPMLEEMKENTKIGIGCFYFSDARWPNTGAHVFYYRNQVYPNFGCVRANVWEQLNGFDERYFSYGSETDLAFRCLQKGHLVIPVKEAKIHHLYIKDVFRKQHVLKAGEYEDLRVKTYGPENDNNYHWMDEEGKIETHCEYKKRTL